MKTIKKTTKYFTLSLLSLSLGLLTACGGDGGGGSSSDDVVTTVPNCTSTAVQNTETGVWSVSTTDSSECQLLTTVASTTSCNYNEIRVRIPVQSTTQQTNQCVIDAYGRQSCVTPVLSNSTNFHQTSGQYQEVCLNQQSPEWPYVVDSGSYYYYNYTQHFSHFQTFQFSNNVQLSPTETLVTFGVLATALFLLN